MASLANTSSPHAIERDLPTHVATVDEAIPAPGHRMPEDGPDMRRVMTVEAMLADLQPFTADQDDVGYVARWRAHLRAIGGSVLLHYGRDGERDITFGLPCDPQVRHRNRWAFFLFNDLEEQAGRRDVLMHALQREGLFWDERPVDRAATTRAMRAFLRVGGRILITPGGQVTEGGEMPRAWMHGRSQDQAEVAEASLAYCDHRQRYRADRHIRRAARMLGQRVGDGWLELRARS